jgi:hypothetical protein
MATATAGSIWSCIRCRIPGHGEDPYPVLARAFGRVLPEGISFDDRRNVRDEHRVVFGLRCRDAAERLELLRERITPLLPLGATTTLT